VRFQRTSVGLDVHARSVVGCGVDREMGEVFQRRLTPSQEEVCDWIRSLPAPAAVVYEAGPTGFGLARYLIDEGIDCVLAAPSKLQRPSGDRIKTDARDARQVYDAAFEAMLTTLDRRDRLDRAIEALAAVSIFTPVVRRLGCVGGVFTLTAFGLAAEIGVWERLTGRSIGAHLGLVPTEYSSG
jgi:transposase